MKENSMTRRILSAVFAAAVIAFSPEATAEPVAGAGAFKPESVYAKFDYMHLEDSTPMEYFALELGEWRPIQAQRIRRGVTTAWHFYEMMPGVRRDDDQPYDYITVSIFPAYGNVSDPAGTEAIFDVYPGIDLEEMYSRADAARSFVRSDLWRVAAVVSSDAGGKPLGEFLLLTFLSGESPNDDEVRAWTESAAHRIETGGLQSAALLIVANPDDDERPYALVTISYAETLAGLLSEGSCLGQDSARTVYKSQVWRTIDLIQEADLAEE
jgi:hypothetical protein